MISLTSSPCGPDDSMCESVWDATHQDWLAQSVNWVIAKPLAIVFLLLLGFFFRWLTHRLIDRFAARAANGMLPEALTSGKLSRTKTQTPATLAWSERRTQRAQTLSSVLKSIASFVIFSIIAVMIISELGYNVAPLLAGAGIVGIALGFEGAQSLVKDFISGVFMFLEDQYGIGDRITVNDVTGNVESLTLRVTRLRAEDGTVWYLRNGEILKVGNRSQP